MNWESFSLGVLAGATCSSLAVAGAAIYLSRRLARLMGPLSSLLPMAGLMGPAQGRSVPRGDVLPRSQREDR